MVASELTRGQGKSNATPLLSAALLVSLAGLSGGAGAAPQGGQVVSGSGSISASGSPGQSTTTITQASDKLSINWQSFNVGTSETVNFLQPNTSALAVNRIFDTQGSQILGRINANGQVWLINPNGVLFGRDAQINVGGLLASTLNPDDASIGSARSNFSGSSTAGVVNLGSINAAQGGYVALLGHSVSNSGQISAPSGTVALSAGSAVSLNFAGSKLLGLEVTSNQVNALAENGGLIQADGGQVLLSAGARESLLASVVNNTGVIQAHTVQEQDGKIILLGGMAAGTTNVKGTLDASAPSGGNGGFIETSAYSVKVDDSASITTASAQGTQGQWLIDPFDFYVKSSGGNITGAALSTALGQNNVTIKTVLSGNPSVIGATASGSYTGTLGDIYVNDSVSWSANYTLTLNAYNSIFINSAITATGTSGKLALLYGQASLTGGSANYFVNAAVSLKEGANFSTKLGTSTSAPYALKNYTVITSLGNAGDQSVASATNSLQGLGHSTRLSGNYVLGSNIDASSTSTWNLSSGIHSGFAPIGDFTNNDVNKRFSGSFDGLGHTISGLTINRPNTGFVGLFGYITRSVIKNVGVTSASVVGSYHVGAMAGFTHGTTSNSYSTGSVIGSGPFGGLIGGNDGTISNSYSAVNLSGTGALGGGLVGLNYRTVTNSYATGSVGGSGGVKGGLVGRNTDTGTISNSHATGAVSGSYSVGGLVGELERNVSANRAGTVSNSYATGAVTATGVFAGGLVGVSSGIVSSSYATGSVGGSGGIKGGLVGRNTDTGTISNSYATGAVSGSYNIGGLVGDVTRAVSATQVVTSGTVSDSYATGTVTATGGDAGGLVGQSRGMISNSYATGSVSGTFSNGGLVGYSGHGTISNSYATGAVRGTSAGGLVGYMDNSGAVSSSYATGSVTGTGSTGGLLGNFLSGSISTSYATGAVSGAQRIGGLVGNSGGTISSSYATGTVRGTTVVGGLVGNQDLGSIDASHATGAVSASTGFAGGLVGDNDATISSSYATGAVSAGTSAGGLVGINNAPVSSSYATGAVNSTGAAGFVGGLIGAANQLSVVSNSYATGAVTGAWLVGGLMGYLSGSLSGSYATGAVTGASGAIRVGGLMGSLLSGGTISDSYAAGAVSGGAYRGGLVGNVYSTTNYSISNTYATGVVSSSGATFYGGLVGRMEASGTGSVTNSYWNSDNTSSAGGGSAGTGLSTAAMKTASNFSAWSMSTVGDSSSTWFTYDGYTNPLLRTFLTALNVTYTVSGSKTYDGTNACITITCSYTTGPLTSGKSILGTVVLSSKNAGMVTATGLYSDQQGYLITASTSGTATIDKANLTQVTASKTYDGLSTVTAAQITAIKGVSGESFTTSAGTAAISDKNVATTNKAITDLSGLTLTGVGGSLISNYNLTSGLPAAGTNNAVTITAKTASVSGTRTNTTYSGATQTQTGATTSGFLDSDSITVSGLASGKNANTYTSTLAVGGTDATNYNVTITNADLAIAKADAVVTASSNTALSYNGAHQTVSGFTASGLQGGESASVLSGVAASTTYKNAGSYRTTASGTDANYNLSFVGGSMVIATAILTYTANKVSTNAGNTPTGLSGTVSGFMRDEMQSTATTGTLAWITPATSASSAGSYAINGSGLLAVNYSFSQAVENATALTLTQSVSIVPVINPPSLSTDTSFTKSAQFAQTTAPLSRAENINTLPATSAGSVQSNGPTVTKALGSSGLLYAQGSGVNLPADFLNVTPADPAQNP